MSVVPQKAATKTKMMSRTRDMSAKCAQPAHAHKERERESERHVHANTHTLNEDGTQWACRYLWPFGRLYIYLYAVNNYVTPPAHVSVCVCAAPLTPLVMGIPLLYALVLLIMRPLLSSLGWVP